MSQRAVKIRESWQRVQTPAEHCGVQNPYPAQRKGLWKPLQLLPPTDECFLVQTKPAKTELPGHSLPLRGTADSLQVAETVSCQDKRINFEVICKLKCNLEGPRMNSFINLPYRLRICSLILQNHSPQ